MKPLMNGKSVTVFCCAFFLFLFNSCSAVKDFTANETNTFSSFDPEIRIMVNSPKEIERSKPSLLIVYALPNGNTIEMTAGKKLKSGDDWHYDIQHIAAQTRFLRNTLKEFTIHIAYLESAQKSWPSWRKKYNDGEIARIVDRVRSETGNPVSVILSGHSGGGSFITGFINAYDTIPGYITRIAYLDANYSYDDSLNHGMKLLQWLRSDSTHHLSVIAYDDREISLNGKKVVSPTGGTYRATQRMVKYFREVTDIKSFQDSTIIQYECWHHRLRFLVHSNPDTLILHTVLVEKNGLIHSVLFNTAFEEKEYSFFGDRAYKNFISGE